MNIYLLSKTENPEKVIYTAMRQCNSYKKYPELQDEYASVSRQEVQDFIMKVLKMGHESPIEHVSFSFAADGISRTTSHQLVRHRIASYSHQSQRYINFKQMEYTVPHKIKNDPKALKIYIDCMEQIQKTYNNLNEMGFEKEDCRMVLPNAAHSSIVITMNCRSLINFLHHRLCSKAQWEIRELANNMRIILQKELPLVFNHVGPKCEQSGFCLEVKGCGRKPYKFASEI